MSNPTDDTLSHPAPQSLFRIALPVVLAYVGQISMTAVDTMAVGRVSASAISGVALGNAVFYTFMVMGFGLLTGLDFLVGHAYGARQMQKCRDIFIQSLHMALLISVPLCLIPFLLAFRLEIFGSAPEVIAQAKTFLQLLSLTMPQILIFMACRQYLQATGRVKVPMYILLAANIINAAANYALVLGNWGSPALGAPGSAMATILARTFMMIAILVYTFAAETELRVHLKKTWLKFNWGTIKSMCKLGLPASVQMVLEVGAFSGSTTFSAKLGAVPAAAHQIVLQIASLTFMVPLGISTAAAVLVSANLGAKNPVEAGRTGWRALGLATAFMTCMSVLLYLAAKPLIRVFTPDEAVIATGSSLMVLAALFQIADGIQVVSTGALRGVADTRTSLFANLAGHWFVGIPLGVYLCFWMNKGVVGIWTGLATGLALVAAALLLKWRREGRSLMAGRIPSRVSENSALSHAMH